MPGGKHLHTLPKQETARGKSLVSRLFSSKTRKKAGPLVMICFFAPSDLKAGAADVKVMFTAGKKLVPLAVQRNRIKRLMREAYRLEKQLLYENPGRDSLQKAGAVRIAFLYRGRREVIPLLEEFRSAMRRLLNELVLHDSKGDPEHNDHEQVPAGTGHTTEVP